jgi:hypothetical protein
MKDPLLSLTPLLQLREATERQFVLPPARSSFAFASGGLQTLEVDGTGGSQSGGVD